MQAFFFNCKHLLKKVLLINASVFFLFNSKNFYFRLNVFFIPGKLNRLPGVVINILVKPKCPIP